jgi:hypothetical protein
MKSRQETYEWWLLTPHYKKVWMEFVMSAEHAEIVDKEQVKAKKWALFTEWEESSLNPANYVSFTDEALFEAIMAIELDRTNRMKR